jgi:hypothetical protein
LKVEQEVAREGEIKKTLLRRKKRSSGTRVWIEGRKVKNDIELVDRNRDIKGFVSWIKEFGNYFFCFCCKMGNNALVEEVYLMFILLMYIYMLHIS